MRPTNLMLIYKENMRQNCVFKNPSNVFVLVSNCAADFALLNLPKGKSLGRSKPATSSSNEQAH